MSHFLKTHGEITMYHMPYSEVACHFIALMKEMIFISQLRCEAL
ncbi:hypothetical protein SLEP1_g28200 [Rubroshorea leprosula]|uniref:Uncharacterized protein n=1 Tax=Rubroshorea leprosula TaxID=152421 RepID=A0AAV5K2A5_9ROSI|nr:hypothetical protein SLEP1_g28200 [Rubroshorea leprosula]